MMDGKLPRNKSLGGVLLEENNHCLSFRVKHDYSVQVKLLSSGSESETRHRRALTITIFVQPICFFGAGAHAHTHTHSTHSLTPAGL